MRLRAILTDSTFRAATDEVAGQTIVQAETTGYAWILVAPSGRKKVALRTDGVIRVGRRSAEWRPKQ